MTDWVMDHQRPGYLHSDPCIHFRGTNIPTPNIRTVMTASGNMTNLDSHYLPDSYDSFMMYGAQYTGIQHQHNLDMRAPAVANLYYSGMNPSSGTGVFPLPLNHGVSDQSPGSSTFAVSGAYKRKNAEGIRGNYQHFNASASSSVASPSAGYGDGVAMMDIASFPLPQYRGNGIIPSLVDVGPHGSTWSRSCEPIFVHDHNNLIPAGPHFQPAAPPWLDQQLNNNNNDGQATAWNQSLPMPYGQAPSVNESSLEDATMGLRRYNGTASSRSALSFPYAPPVNPQHHNFHRATLPMLGMNGHSISFHPPAASYRVPSNHSRSYAIPTPNDFEMGARHVGTARRHHRGVVPDTTYEHRNLSPMGFIQVDDVALLVDHHRDMRLDIEDMSYEELLALGERIGNVSTGLSEEIITTQMKTKTYLIPAADINLEEEPSEGMETDTCTICLDEYKSREKIGILECGHEYHANCLRKWLLVKNVCPVCKSEALDPEGKGV